MKRIIIILTALFLASCTLPEGALTPTLQTTPTTEATNTAQPTATSTEAATETPEPTETAEPVLSAELFYNGDLYVNPYVTPSDGVGGTLRVADGWVLDYNRHPDLHICEEGQNTDCNSADYAAWVASNREYNTKPEAKPADLQFQFSLYPEPGQQWFFFQKLGDAALGQTVNVTAGSSCVVSFDVLDYQQFDFYYGESINPDASGFNSNWYIYLTEGDDRPWDGGTVQLTHWQGWDEVISVRAEFIAPADEITLWVRNTRGYPITHQESIVYDASLKCYETPEEPQPTPEPEEQPTPTAVVPVTPVQATCDIVGGWYVDGYEPQWTVTANDGLRIRSCPIAASFTLTGAMLYDNQTIQVEREYIPRDGDYWIGFECPYSNDLCWVAIAYEGQTFGCWEDVCVP